MRIVESTKTKKRNYLGFTSSANITKWFSLALYLTKWNDSWMSLTTIRVPIVLRPIIKLGSFWRQKHTKTEITTFKYIFRKSFFRLFALCPPGSSLVDRQNPRNLLQEKMLSGNRNRFKCHRELACGTTFPGALFAFGSLNFLSGAVTGQ